MSLDDRSLGEHLDRRAAAGLTNPDDLAEAVIAGLPKGSQVSGWRPLARGTRALGLAAAAVVAVVVAIALVPRTVPGPGASSLPSATAEAATPPVMAYPADRPLTLDELNWYLGAGPHLRAGSVVVADVELSQNGLVCDSAYCPNAEVAFPDRPITVYRWDAPDLPGPYALLVKPEGDLELVGAVRTGPEGLTWSLAEYLKELPGLLGPGVIRTGEAYVVEADAVRSLTSPSCPAAFPLPSAPVVDFGCGAPAWLLPPGSDVPGSRAPDGSLRIQNNASIAGPGETLVRAGYFVVRPVDVEECFMCIPGQTSQFLAALTPIQLPTSGPTTSDEPSSSPLAVKDITFSTTSMNLTRFETADFNVTVTFDGTAVEREVDGSFSPLICLQKVGAFPDDYPHSTVIPRTLLPVDGTDEWVASFRMTAGDDGRWNVGCLVAYDTEGRELNANPALDGQSPDLDITGFRGPHLTMEFEPSPAVIGQPLVVFGQVTDEDTGETLRGETVTIGIDTVCTQGGQGETVTTNANGEYSYEIPVADAFVVCAWITDFSGIIPGANAQDPIAVYAVLLARPVDL